MADFDADFLVTDVYHEDGHPPIGDADYAETIVVATDTTDPVVSNFSAPASKHDRAEFDVTDESGLSSIVCLVKLSPTGSPELVHVTHGDLDVAGADYAVERIEIANGYHYAIARRGGWPTGVSLTFYALPVDTGGNTD